MKRTDLLNVPCVPSKSLKGPKGHKGPKGLALLGCLAALQTNASACAVCMGGDDTVMRNASNSTLWALLALVGFIFMATGATAFFLWRKATTFKTTSIA